VTAPASSGGHRRAVRERTARDGLPTNQASFGSPLYRLTPGHRPLSHHVRLEHALQRAMLAQYGRVVE